MGWWLHRNRSTHDRALMRNSSIRGTWIVVVAFLLALLASVSLLVIFTLGLGVGSIGGSIEGSVTGEAGLGGSGVSPMTRLVSIRIADAIFFALPVLIAAIPLLFRGQLSAIISRSIATIVLFLWVLFLAFGGGIFYLPSVAAMALSVVAAALQEGGGGHLGAMGDEP
jgi:hypothetical protein